MVFYTLFFLLPAYIAPLFLLMAALAFVTAMRRVWWASQHLHENRR